MAGPRGKPGPGGLEHDAPAVRADLDLGSLEVREGTGGVKPLTDADRRDIKKTMSVILGAATATFASSRVDTSGAVEGTATYQGRSQPIRLQVSTPGPGQYRGSAALTQTGFGIKPYTGFFGALKLKDEVRVEFEVDLSRSREAGPRMAPP